MQSASLKRDREVNKPFTRMQAFISIAMLLLAILGAWGSMSSQLKQDGKDYENHEQRIQAIEKRAEKFETKLDKIADQNTQILILLQNKQDRK